MNEHRARPVAAALVPSFPTFAAEGDPTRPNGFETRFWATPDQRVSLQYCRAERPTEFPEHSHPEYSFVVCLRGAIEVRQLGVVDLVTAGEVVVGNAYEPHTSSYGAGGALTEAVTLAVTPQPLAAHWSESRPEPFPAINRPLLLGKSRLPEAVRLAERVTEELRRRVRGQDLALAALASLLLIEILRSWRPSAHAAIAPAPAEPRLGRRELVQAIAYMYECPKGRFQTAELARHVGSSTGRFTRLFVASTGKTPVRLYDEILLRGAEESLASGATTKEAAFRLGFRSPSHFCQFYRRMTGRPPGRLRCA